MNRAYRLLIVEDVPEEIELTVATIEDLNLDLHIDSCNDGESALEFLEKKGKYSDALTPDLIFLDLNMPRMDGREFLAILRSHERLRTIPVIILTTSASEEDIRHCYEAGCNAYLTKPMGLKEYRNTFRTVAEYWFKTTTLPGFL